MALTLVWFMCVSPSYRHDLAPLSHSTQPHCTFLVALQKTRPRARQRLTSLQRHAVLRCARCSGLTGGSSWVHCWIMRHKAHQEEWWKQGMRFFNRIYRKAVPRVVYIFIMHVPFAQSAGWAVVGLSIYIYYGMRSVPTCRAHGVHG